MRKIKICWHDLEDGVSHDAEIEIGKDDDAVEMGFFWFHDYIETCPGLKAAGASTIDIEGITEIVDGKTKYHFIPYLSNEER